MNRFLCLVLSAFALLFSACDRRIVYDQYQSTPIAGWEKNDTLTFGVPPVSDGANYCARLGLRTTDAYPFTAVTLIVVQQILPSNRVVVDTVRCGLTDEQGNVLGSGLSYRQYRFDITRLSLQAGDSLHVSVRHDMKREILPGIADVGIMLEKE